MSWRRVGTFAGVGIVAVLLASCTQDDPQNGSSRSGGSSVNGSPATVAGPSQKQDATVPSTERSATPEATTSDPKRPRFTDATKRLGLDGAPQQDREGTTSAGIGPADVMSGSIAVVDINGDGWEDIYLPRVRMADALFFNNKGKGFVEAPAGTLPRSAEDSHGASAWADLDGDGDVDGIVTGIGTGPTALLIQQPNGTFVDMARPAGVVVAPNAQVGEQLLFGVSLGDLDRDGDLDAIISGWRHNPNAAAGQTTVFFNDGAAKFTPQANLLPGVDKVAAFTSTITDLNGDGFPDVAIAADWHQSRLYMGSADGFVDATQQAGVGTDENGMGSVLADLDGNGTLDWFITAVASPNCAGPVDATARIVRKGCTGNRLYLGDGKGGFTDATDPFGVRDGAWGWGVDAGDLENDGDLDLVQTNGFRTPKVDRQNLQFVDDVMRVFFNDGTRPWAEDAAGVGLSDSGDGKGLTLADFDHDGDLDVFVVDNVDGPRVYENTTAKNSRWCEVSLTDPQKRPVVEATVEISLGGDPVRRDLRVGDHFAAQGPAVVHVGLGSVAGDSFDASIQRPGGKTLSIPDVCVRGSRQTIELPSA